MKRFIILIVLCNLWFLCFSQTEVVRFSYSPNGERIEREVIVLGGKDINKSCESLFSFDKESRTINIYPNPFQNELKIEIEGEDTDEFWEYTVYSIRGTYISSGNLKNGEILEFGDLSPGVYFLTLFIENDKKTWKLIKK